MPVHVDQVPDRPIIIATFSGDVTVEDVIEMFRVSAELLKSIPGNVYRISDIRDAILTMDTILAAAKSTREHTPGSTADARIIPCFVGYNPLAQHYSDLMLSHIPKKQIPVYPSLEVAFNAIHKLMQNRGSDPAANG